MTCLKKFAKNFKHISLSKEKTKNIKFFNSIKKFNKVRKLLPFPKREREKKRAREREIVDKTSMQIFANSNKYQISIVLHKSGI